MSLSADGKTLLFREEGEAGGPSYAVYIRQTDGSPAVRLGDGQALALSPDGKWALSSKANNESDLFLLPTGAGEPKALDGHAISRSAACWFASGDRILYSGTESGHGARLYVQDINTNKVEAISPEGTNALSFALSPDGRVAAGVGPDKKAYLYPIPAGEPKAISGVLPDEVPVAFTADGGSLFVYRGGEMPAKVYRLELGSGS